jgi:hypothetical protein
MLSAGSLTVLPTVRFSSATIVSFTAAANSREDALHVRRGNGLLQLLMRLEAEIGPPSEKIDD